MRPRPRRPQGKERIVDIEEHHRQAILLDMLAGSLVGGDVPLRTEPGWEGAWQDYFRRQRAHRAAGLHLAHILRHEWGDMSHSDADSPTIDDI